MGLDAHRGHIRMSRRSISCVGPTPGTRVSVLTTPVRQSLGWYVEHTIIGIHMATICGAEKGQQPSVPSQSNSTGHGDAGETDRVQTLPWKASHVLPPLAARYERKCQESTPQRKICLRETAYPNCHANEPVAGDATQKYLVPFRVSRLVPAKASSQRRAAGARSEVVGVETERRSRLRKENEIRTRRRRRRRRRRA